MEYPVQFSVDYPDRPLNRLSTALRIFWVIPIVIVLGAVSGRTWQATIEAAPDGSRRAGGAAVPRPAADDPVPAEVPRWWFDWNLELQRFTSRVGVYLALMDDRYPSTDDHQSVHLDYPYPDARARSEPLAAAGQVAPRHPALRGAVLPVHRRVRGRDRRVVRHPVHRPLPAGLFGFVEGVIRWHNRVTAYAFTLVTDLYPPFRLAP